MLQRTMLHCLMQILICLARYPNPIYYIFTHYIHKIKGETEVNRAYNQKTHAMSLVSRQVVDAP